MKMKIFLLFFICLIGNLVAEPVDSTNIGKRENISEMYRILKMKFISTNKEAIELNQKILDTGKRLTEIYTIVSDHKYLIEKNKKALYKCTENKKEQDKIALDTYNADKDDEYNSDAKKTYSNALNLSEEWYQKCLKNNQSYNETLAKAKQEIRDIKQELNNMHIGMLADKYNRLEDRLATLTEMANHVNIKLEPVKENK